MHTRHWVLFGVTIGLTSACSRPSQPDPSSHAVPSASAAVVAAASGPAKEPAVARPSKDRIVTGEGITITETTTGEVKLKTIDLWKGPIDTTYENCGFFTAAVPVLERQLSPDRAKLLKSVCADAAAPPK
jgi:hypothetical protein